MELATPLVAKLPGPPAHRLCLHLRSQDRMDEKCDKEKRELFQWTQKHMLGCALVCHPVDPGAHAGMRIGMPHCAELTRARAPPCIGVGAGRST